MPAPRCRDSVAANDESNAPIIEHGHIDSAVLFSGTDPWLAPRRLDVVGSVPTRKPSAVA
jgi:hypothetical protein